MPVISPQAPPRSRGRGPWTTVIIALLTLLVGVPAGLFFCAGLAVRNMFCNCTQRSPLVPFHGYLGEVPPGVSNVRSAGAVSLGGADIFLRFRATDAAVAVLAKSFGPDEGKLEDGELGRWDADFEKGVAQGQSRQPFEHQVHWDELRRIRHPHVYRKARSETSWDLLIWDPEHQRAYFYHTNT